MRFDAVGFAQAARAQGISDPEIRRVIDEEAQLELGRRGKLQPGEKIDPSTRLQLEEEGIEIQPEITAEEKKKTAAKKGLTESLSLLEKNLNEISTRGPLAGRTGLLSKITGGAIAPDIADFDALRKGLIGPVARVISQEVGVLTDRDIKRAEGLLPKVTDTKELAEKKLANIRVLLEGGKPDREIEEIVQIQESGSSLMQLLAGAQISLGKSSALPVAGGILGGVLSAPGVVTTGLGAGIGATLGKSAQQLVSGQVEGRTGVEVLPTKKEARGAIKAGAGTALTTLLLGGAVKGAGKILRPFKTVGEFRSAKIAEARGGAISGDKILKVLEERQKVLSPTQQKSFSRFLETARQQFTGKTISVEDAVKLNQEANKAFTAAGKVGKSAIASFNKAMGDSIKSQLKGVAPDVEKANRIFRLLFGAKRVTQRVVPRIIEGSVIGGFLRGAR